MQEQTQVEQSQISIADLMDNFKEGRAMVGELILALEIEDLGEEREVIVIEGDTINPPRTVVLNEAVEEGGLRYLSNDVQRTRLKGGLVGCAVLLELPRPAALGPVRSRQGSATPDAAGGDALHAGSDGPAA